jgi:hypothetical protein
MFKIGNLISGLLPGFGFSQPSLGGMNATRSGSQMKVQRPSFC